jgi:RNA methyltransferase, TrmH family
MPPLPQLKPYRKEMEHSYAPGVFPALEMLAHRPESVLQVLLHSRGERNEGVRKLREECARLRVRVETNDRAIERLAPKENTYALGVFSKWSDSLRPTSNHVMLVNPSDMGNLGTIMRTMLGFGVDDLALVRPAADVFDPRAVRASMGALFSLRTRYFSTFEEYREQYGHNLYPFMTGGEGQLGQVEFREPFALVFGNEAAGLGAEYLEVGTPVRIAHTERIDSLNLPVAVAIALYEATRTP